MIFLHRQFDPLIEAILVFLESSDEKKNSNLLFTEFNNFQGKHTKQTAIIVINGITKQIKATVRHATIVFNR